jgi:hypothetical protein
MSTALDRAERKQIPDREIPIEVAYAITGDRHDGH